MTLKDTAWLPWFLGGKGAWENFGDFVPFCEIPDGVTNYYMLELGYITGASIEHMFFEERTNDFVMYTLHHVCAFMLIVSSYMANNTGVGSLVLFHLDIADIWTNSASGFGQTRYDMAAASTFFMLLATWFYTRLMILPWIVYKLMSDQHKIVEPFYS